MRYSPSLSATWAKPSGCAEALSPYRSASYSCTRTIEFKTGVSSVKYAVISSAASGRPATSSIPRTRHLGTRACSRSKSVLSSANPTTITTPNSSSALWMWFRT